MVKLKLVPEVLRNVFKRPVTIQYPYEPIEPTPDYRGQHRVNGDKCIGCRLCAIDCPTGAIQMRKFPQKDKPVPVIITDLCIYCYHCVYVCPVKAYIISNERPEPFEERGREILPLFKERKE